MCELETVLLCMATCVLLVYLLEILAQVHGLCRQARSYQDSPPHTCTSHHNKCKLIACLSYSHALNLLQVVHYVVSDCSKYTTCDSCAADKDPLCGWCVLENKCSSHSTCKSSDLAGRWVQHQSQCILSVTLNEQYVSADGLSSVSTQIITQS